MLFFWRFLIHWTNYYCVCLYNSTCRCCSKLHPQNMSCLNPSNFIKLPKSQVVNFRSLQPAPPQHHPSPSPHPATAWSVPCLQLSPVTTRRPWAAVRRPFSIRPCPRAHSVAGHRGRWSNTRAPLRGPPAQRYLVVSTSSWRIMGNHCAIQTLWFLNMKMEPSTRFMYIYIHLRTHYHKAQGFSTCLSSMVSLSKSVCHAVLATHLLKETMFTHIFCFVEASALEKTVFFYRRDLCIATSTPNYPV